MASISAADGYGLFHEGPGTPSLDDAAHAGQELLSRYNDRMDQVSGLVQGISGSWSGSASDAAQAGAMPLVRSLQQSHDALTTTQDLMARQSGSFHDGARSVQQMPDQPPQPSIGDFLPPWSNSYQDKVDKYIGQAQANVTAMHNYGSATGYNSGGTPSSYGGVTGGGSDITIAPDQGPDGPGGSGGGQPGPGGGGHYQSHAPGGGGYTPGGVNGGGPGAGSYSGSGPGAGLPGGGGDSGPGTSTNQQGWQGGAPGQGPGYGAPGYGQSGDGSFGPGAVGGFGSVGGFGGGSDSSYGGGSGRGGVGGGAGARGFGAAAGPGTQAGNQQGAGNRAGVGATAGEGGPGAAAAAGRAGAPGASGASGMGAAGGRGGKKDEDLEHKSAAYLEDDYSDDIVGELPRTVPPVIGMD